MYWMVWSNGRHGSEQGGRDGKARQVLIDT